MPFQADIQSMSEITVVMPVHDPIGTGKTRLIRAMRSIALQNNPPHTVMISSNHRISYLSEIEALASGKFRLLVFLNESRGAAENLNFLLEQVSSRYSKVLFQDDFLKSAESLEKIERSLGGSPHKWLVHGCDHFYEASGVTSRIHRPFVNRGLVRGVNKIGAPSVIAFKNGLIPKFNEGMVYMFDCEWYLRMQHLFGEPVIVNEPLVTIGIHPDQATGWAQNFLKEEIAMTKKLHPTTIFQRRCKFCKRFVSS